MGAAAPHVSETQPNIGAGDHAEQHIEAGNNYFSYARHKSVTLARGKVATKSCHKPNSLI